MLIKNKRGWIRIVEAFVAVLIIAGVLLVVINKGYIGKTDISQKVYDSQLSILREIELDDTLRQSIITAVIDEENGLEETSTTHLPQNINDKIDSRTPDYLSCKAKICALDKICNLAIIPDKAKEKDIYTQSVAISATLTNYNPRQLKLFCWVK